jgi:hypothetical protein
MTRNAKPKGRSLYFITNPKCKLRKNNRCCTQHSLQYSKENKLKIKHFFSSYRFILCKIGISVINRYCVIRHLTVYLKLNFRRLDVSPNSGSMQTAAVKITYNAQLLKITFLTFWHRNMTFKF